MQTAIPSLPPDLIPTEEEYERNAQVLDKPDYTQEVEHTLENLQRIVGGLIEPIYFYDMAIIVN